MHRKFNALAWFGFALTLLATFSYIPVFTRFAGTRDFPWPNLAMFLAGGCMLAVGLKRAYGSPERYRGKIAAPVLSVLAVTLFGLFYWGLFVFARRVPVSAAAPRPGQQAPDFTLADANGRPVSLTELRRANRAVLLIFYRGYW
ncbi:MAG TPA: hypothetical protein VMI94_01075 [Bryobacteraceae bacterium]|nr:hypothetical protein [Bryobacteraceae bacterium]